MPEKPPGKRLAAGLALMALLGVFLVAAVVGAYKIWSSMEGGEMSTHGIVALIGGGILTILVGGGLMALVFLSNRLGMDDRVGQRETAATDEHEAKNPSGH